MKNRILLPSAVHLEERLTVSQSLSQQAGSQSDTHSLGFLSVADAGPKQQGGPSLQSKQWSSGKAADQYQQVGGSNPSLAL